MNLIVEIALKYLINRRRASIVTISGVALGVSLFVAMSALMLGFEHYFVSKIIDVSPHIVIKDEFRGIPKQPAQIAYGDRGRVLIASLKPRDEIRGIKRGMQIVHDLEEDPNLKVAPTLMGQVFLRYGTKTVNATLYGIHPSREKRVTNLERDLIKGSLKALSTTANGIILGAGVAEKVGVDLGDNLNAISPAGVIMRMKVVGIFRSGITSIDNGEAFTLLKKSQILQDRANVINQIRIRVSQPSSASAYAAMIEKRYKYRTEAWEESNKNILSIFIIQQSITFSSVGALLLVAAFGIYNITSTIIHEKVRDIAIMKSIGFRERDLRLAFLIQGVIIGIVGTLMGWLLGYTLVLILGSIRFHLEGFITAEGFVLYRSFALYLVGGVFAIISTTLASYLPSLKASKLNPVDIIRSAT